MNKKGLKGQTEIVILLGVVVVSIVVVLLATKTVVIGPEPEAVSAIKVSLKTDLQTRVTADATAVIKKVAANGGYLDLNTDPKPPTLDDLGSKIAFWQYGNITICFLLETTKARLTPRFFYCLFWCAIQDSNLGPRHYQ